MSRVWRVLKTAGKGRGEKSEPSCRELWKHSPQRGDIWGGGQEQQCYQRAWGGHWEVTWVERAHAPAPSSRLTPSVE